MSLNDVDEGTEAEQDERSLPLGTTGIIAKQLVADRSFQTQVCCTQRGVQRRSTGHTCVLDRRHAFRSIDNSRKPGKVDAAVSGDRSGKLHVSQQKKAEEQRRFITASPGAQHVQILQSLAGMMVDSSRQGAKTEDTYCLPVKIIACVAKYLVANHQYGTCAALSATSRTIRDEIRPILCQTFILWGSRVLCDSAFSPTFGTVTPAQQNNARTVWNKYRKTDGVKCMEVLARPASFLSDAHNYEIMRRLHASSPASTFPKLKASIGLYTGTQMENIASYTGVAIHLCDLYQHGTNNCLDLIDSVDYVYNRSGPLLQIAVAREDGVIMKCSANPKVKLLSVRDRVNCVVPWMKRYTGVAPRHVTVNYEEGTSKETLAATFLDAAMWVSEYERAFGQMRTVKVICKKVDFMIECAKEFQKAVEVYPKLAQIHLRLEMWMAPKPSAAELDEFLSICRITALSVAKKIPFKDLGAYALDMKFQQQGSVLAVCMVCPDFTMKKGKKQIVSMLWEETRDVEFSRELYA